MLAVARPRHGLPDRRAARRGLRGARPVDLRGRPQRARLRLLLRRALLHVHDDRARRTASRWSVFLVVAVLTSQLTARVRDQAEAARRREARTAALYAFAREIAAAASIDDLLRVVVEHVAGLFGVRTALLLPEAGRARGARSPPAGHRRAGRGARDRRVGVRARPGGRAGAPTRCRAVSGCTCRSRRCAARSACSRSARERLRALLALDQRQLLEALAGQAAVAIERTRIDVVLGEGQDRGGDREHRGRPGRARPRRRRSCT